MLVLLLLLLLLLGCWSVWIVWRRQEHLLAANDARGVGARSQLLLRHVRIHDVEIAYGTLRHDNVVECLLERAQRHVHGPYGEERKRVYLDHERHEYEVEEDAQEAEHQVGVQHVDALVLPRILVLQVDRVQQVARQRAHDVREQYGILK